LRKFGCRSRARTWANGFKVRCATTTQIGNLCCYGAEGRGRTDMRVAPQWFLRPSRLPVPPLRLEKQMERKTRLELATSSLARRHSTTELLPLENGAEGQNRTGDTRIFSPLLYLLSYLGNTNRIIPITQAKRNFIKPEAKEAQSQSAFQRLTSSTSVAPMPPE
jgi:hypothetical protein